MGLPGEGKLKVTENNESQLHESQLSPAPRAPGGMSTPRLRSALRLPWYIVLLVATYCLLHLGLAVEHPCASCVDTYAPGPPYRTYGLRVPASCHRPPAPHRARTPNTQPVRATPAHTPQRSSASSQVCYSHVRASPWTGAPSSASPASTAQASRASYRRTPPHTAAHRLTLCSAMPRRVAPSCTVSRRVAPSWLPQTAPHSLTLPHSTAQASRAPTERCRLARMPHTGSNSSLADARRVGGRLAG